MGTEYRHPLVKHLPNLKQELQNQHKEDPEKLSKAILDLEKLSYYLEATCFSVRELLLKANELAHESGERGGMKGMNILVWKQDRDPLAFHVDNFLDAIRRAQNAICPYLSRALRVSTPDSLSDLIKKINSGKMELPQEISKLISDYWTQYGAIIKSYRDLSQHFRIVSSEAALKFDSDGKAYLYLVLPNNPEVKNESLLVWESPFVHAIPYVVENFFVLVDVLNNLVEKLLKQPVEKYIPVIEFSNKGLSIPAELIRIPAVADFDEKVDSYRKKVLDKDIS
jgi:hypothetical protein